MEVSFFSFFFLIFVGPSPRKTHFRVYHRRRRCRYPFLDRPLDRGGRGRVVQSPSWPVVRRIYRWDCWSRWDSHPRGCPPSRPSSDRSGAGEAAPPSWRSRSARCWHGSGRGRTAGSSRSPRASGRILRRPGWPGWLSSAGYTGAVVR